MGRQRRTPLPVFTRRAEALGQRLKVARIRRRMSEIEMAQRALMSRQTLRKLEAGDLSVGLAVLADVLEILGLGQDLDLIAGDDTAGVRIADARLPRPRRSSVPKLADEL